MNENKSKLYTYGEAHIYVLMSDWIMDGKKTVSVKTPPHKPRMGKAEAGVYYTDKINKEFIRLGYKREIRASEFDNADDYFGYYEALRLKQELIA